MVVEREEDTGVILSDRLRPEIIALDLFPQRHNGLEMDQSCEGPRELRAGVALISVALQSATTADITSTCSSSDAPTATDSGYDHLPSFQTSSLSLEYYSTCRASQYPKA